MEWIAEGLTLIFIGVTVLMITITGGPDNPVSLLVIRTSEVFLVVLAGLSAMTGVKGGCALLFIIGTTI
jgi:hypothetical protein